MKTRIFKAVFEEGHKFKFEVTQLDKNGSAVTTITPSGTCETCKYYTWYDGPICGNKKGCVEIYDDFYCGYWEAK